MGLCTAPNKEDETEIRSCLLILGSKEDMLQDSGKEGDNTFHKVLVLGTDGDLWDRVRGLGSENWKGYELVELLMVLTRLKGTGIITLIS